MIGAFIFGFYCFGSEGFKPVLLAEDFIIWCCYTIFQAFYAFLTGSLNFTTAILN